MKGGTCMKQNKLKVTVVTAKNKATKAMALLSLPVAGAVLFPIATYAADASSTTGDLIDTVAPSLVSSIQGMVSSIGGAIGSIIPVALPLVGVSMAITIALAIFKKVTNKA